MKTLDEFCTAEIVEKKSKFICSLYHIDTKEEAETIINNAKKQYFDARHNCYAYIIYDKEQDNVVTKMSDDGEPSGTAGSPILATLKASELVNVVAIVTRYFGGILLGTGGLVRAYKQATVEAIDRAKLYEVEKGYLIQIEVDYTENEKLQFFCKKNNINIVNVEYLNSIKYILEINEKNKELLETDIRYNNLKFDIICEKMIKSAIHQG